MELELAPDLDSLTEFSQHHFTLILEAVAWFQIHSIYCLYCFQFICQYFHCWICLKSAAAPSFEDFHPAQRHSVTTDALSCQNIINAIQGSSCNTHSSRNKQRAFSIHIPSATAFLVWLLHLSVCCLSYVHCVSCSPQLWSFCSDLSWNIKLTY